MGVHQDIRSSPTPLRSWRAGVSPVSSAVGAYLGRLASFYCEAGVRRRTDQRLVEKLVPQPSVGALAVGAPLQVLRLNVLPVDVLLVRQLQDRIRCQLGTYQKSPRPAARAMR
jgi:hypothetical protein